MGITIGSKRYGCDMGNFGFNRFREKVVSKVSEEIFNHYLQLNDSSLIFLSGEERKKYFIEYDAKTNEFISSGKLSWEVANFLYQTDSKGAINRKQAKIIYELIKDCDDDIIYGYSGKPDCAKMSDLKKIFSDKTKVEWC